MTKSIPCIKCDVSKPLNYFYDSTIRKSNLTGECKKCVRARVNVSNKQSHRVTFYSSESGKQLARDKFQRYLSKYASRHAVRIATNLAVLRGELIKSEECEECLDAESRIQAHHDNYNKQLDVRWLCIKCHSTWHHNNTPIYESH